MNRALLCLSALLCASACTAYSPVPTEIRDRILQLRDNDEGTRIRAANRLQDLGVAAHEATMPLLDAAERERGVAQFPYLAAAASVSPGHRTTVRLLAIAAAMEDPLAANHYLDMLGRMGHEAASAVPFLVEILRSPHPLRAEAALARIGLPAAEALVPALRTSNDPVASGRFVRALQRLGSHEDAAQIVPSLVGLLASEKRDLQYAGLRALGSYGDHATKAADAIEAMILAADDPKALPAVGCSSLSRLGAAGVGPLAVIAAVGKEPVQVLAILTLRDMGAVANGAVPTLTRLKRSNRLAVRQAAIEALPHIR